VRGCAIVLANDVEGCGLRGLIIDQKRPAESDNAAVISAPVARRTIGPTQFEIDIHFEADSIILAEGVNFPALPGAVKIEAIAIVTEVNRDDIGDVLLREAYPADLRLLNYGLDFFPVLYLPFISSHSYLPVPGLEQARRRGGSIERKLYACQVQIAIRGK
jgi:hypothetical protein